MFFSWFVPAPIPSLHLTFIIIIIVLHHFSAVQYVLDGFPDMLLSHITRFRAVGNVANGVLKFFFLPNNDLSVCANLTKYQITNYIAA